MKQLLITSAIIFSTAAAAFGQGTILVGNNFGKTVRQDPIFGPEPSNPYLAIVGQSSIGFPTGTTVYTGSLLQGSDYTMAFYLGPTTATSVSGMTLATAVTSFHTATGNVLPAGLLNSTYNVVVPGIPGGSDVSGQMFAWQTTDSAIGAPFVTPITQAEAFDDWVYGDFLYGAGPVFTAGPLATPPATPLNAIGGTSFNISLYVPEPTTLGLAAMGAAGMLLIRRKK